MKNLLYNIIGNVEITFKLSFIPAALIMGLSELDLLDFIDNWFDQNTAYISFVCLAIVLNHLSGTIVHAFIERDFSLIKNIKGLVLMLFAVTCIGALFEGFGYIYTREAPIVEYLEYVIRTMVFMYPARSAAINISIMTGGKFPPVAWLNNMSRFNTSLDVKELFDKVPPKTETRTDHYDGLE